MAPELGAPSRRRAVLSTVLGTAVVYIAVLAVVNLEGTGAAAFLHRVFPRLDHGALDSASVNAAWGDIERRYVIRSVDGQVGTTGAERGMIDELKQRYGDRFSTYLTPDEAKTLHADLAGQRGGSIGIALAARCASGPTCSDGERLTLVVEQVLRDQPAARAGLRPGDVLVSVDGRGVSGEGKTMDERLSRVSAAVRGRPGTNVRLGIVRGGTATELTVTRRDLTIPSVYSQRFGKALYLQISGFDETTGDDARRTLAQNLRGDVSAVVLDLRRNGGGYVSSAQRLASQFVSPRDGRRDVVVRRGRLDARGSPATAMTVTHDELESNGVATTTKVVLLVDGDSASASEIVAACLRDYGRATIVGQKTFGKGSVQEDFTLPDGGDLHLTVEKWFGPKGESIDNAGIAPDRAVALDSPDHRFTLDAIGPDPALDAQLQAALSIAAG